MKWSIFAICNRKSEHLPWDNRQPKQFAMDDTGILEEYVI